MSTLAAVLGRILIALLFVLSGIGKLINPAPTGGMMASIGFPENFALLVGLFEVVFGLLLAIGLLTRLVSLVLLVFTGATVVLFHNAIAEPSQMVNALKNLAVMGGLLMVFAYGQMRWSYDHWRARARVHDAELRAARAEGKAEGLTTAPAATTVVHED